MNDEQAKLNREIGSRIRWQREFLGFTRDELSEMADISTQFLADIEMGRKSMTATTIRNLSKALSVSCDYILFGNKDEDDHPHMDLSIDFIDNYSTIVEKMTPSEREGANDLLLSFAKALIRIKTDDHIN